MFLEEDERAGQLPACCLDLLGPLSRLSEWFCSSFPVSRKTLAPDSCCMDQVVRHLTQALALSLEDRGSLAGVRGPISIVVTEQLVPWPSLLWFSGYPG